MIGARYTAVLADLLEDERFKELIEESLSEYPMYTKEPHPAYISTREQLNKKLLDHYKYREIGFETPARFADELRIAMNEIMPYYVQLYKSHDIMENLDDPFGNVDITETFEEETTGNAKGSTSGTSSSSSDVNSSSESNTEMGSDGKSVNSATPQGQLDISSKNIDSLDYADDAKWNKENSTSHGTNSDESHSTSESETSADSESETSGTTKHTLTRKGNQGVNTYAHDMKELRETFLNIDKMIITDKAIAELFMLVW